MNSLIAANGAPRIKPGRRAALKQLLILQQTLFQAANDPSTSKADLARLAVAWKHLESQKRIVRNKPLPGSLKPVPKPPRGRIIRAEPLPDPLDLKAG